MNRLLDKTIYAQTSWDSATPSGLTALAHQFNSAGEHQVSMQKAGREVRSFPIQVMEGSLKTGAPAQTAAVAPPQQLNIHLVHPEAPGQEKKADPFITGPKGYVVFHAPDEPEGYALVSQLMVKGKRKETFNSQSLTKGDYFTVTLIRPGKYAMTNVPTGAKGTLTMAYPVVGDKPYRPPEPARIKCTAHGFEPPAVSLQPLQTVIFEFQVPSRVKIDLVEPTERPKAT